MKVNALLLPIISNPKPGEKVDKWGNTYNVRHCSYFSLLVLFFTKQFNMIYDSMINTSNGEIINSELGSKPPYDIRESG